MLSGPENSNSIRKDVDSLRSRGILFFPSQEAWGRGWGWGVGEAIGRWEGVGGGVYGWSIYPNRENHFTGEAHIIPHYSTIAKTR